MNDTNEHNSGCSQGQSDGISVIGRTGCKEVIVPSSLVICLPVCISQNLSDESDMQLLNCVH